MDPATLADSFLEQFSHPAVLEADPDVGKVRTTEIQPGGKQSFRGDESVNAFAGHVGGLYQKRLAELKLPADEDARQKLEDGLRTRARAYAVGELSKRMLADRQGVGALSPEYVVPRVAPIAGEAAMAVGQGVERRDNERAFREGQAGYEHYASVARQLAQQQWEQGRKGAAGLVDAATAAPAAIAGFEGAGGVGALGSVAGSGTLKKAGQYAVGTMLRQAPVRSAQALAEESAPSAPRPVLTEQGLQFAPGEDYLTGAAKGAGRHVVGAGAFGAVGAFSPEAAASRPFLMSVAEGLGAIQASDEVQHALKLSPQASPLRRWATAQTPEEKQQAAWDFLGGAASMAAIQAGMHGLGYLQSQGHKVDLKEYGKAAAEVIAEESVEEMAQRHANEGGANTSITVNGKRYYPKPPPKEVVAEEHANAPAQADIGPAPQAAAPAAPAAGPQDRAEVPPPRPEAGEPGGAAQGPGAGRLPGAEGDADRAAAAAPAGDEPGRPAQPEPAAAAGVPPGAGDVLSPERVEEFRSMLEALGTKTGRMSDAKVVEEAKRLKLDQAQEQRSAGTISRPGGPYADTPRMRGLVEEADRIRASSEPTAEGHTRLWRGNRPGEEGKATAFTSSLEGIALPFQKSYGGELSYVDVPTADLSRYENRAGTAPGVEFNLPDDLAKEAKPVARPATEARKLKLDQAQERSTGTVRPPTALDRMREESQPATEAERRTLPGGGQEEATGAKPPQKLTALANAKVDEERQARGEQPLMQAARLEDPVVWDRAMDRLEKDPTAAEKLVEEINAKPRQASDEENAVLLRHRVALGNETTKAQLEYIDSFKNHADAITREALHARAKELDGEMNELDQALRLAGTEWGRAGRWRRVLAAEDYSLQGMLRKAAAAKGEELAPEEQAKIADLQKQIADLQGRLDEATKAAEGKGPHSPEFKEVEKATAATEAAKDKYKVGVQKLRDQGRGTAERVTDLLLRIRRAFVISSPKTMAKITAAAAARFVTGPAEEAAGAALRKLPGIARIAALAPRHGRGFSATTEIKSAVAGLTQGFADAWQTMKTGRSELDMVYGKGRPDVPLPWLDLVGDLHAAAKAPVKRAEFTRSFLQRVEHAAKNGADVTSPAKLLQIGTEAYADANRAIFMQDNRVVQVYNAAVNQLQHVKPTPATKALAFTVKMMLPIVKVPSNFVAEAVEHAVGSVTGSAQAALALRRGVETMKPAEADAVMRQLKKGSLGAAAMAVGFFAPGVIGGLFQPGEKRKKGDVPVGATRTPAGDVPSWALHSPVMEAAQFGSTVRRAYDAVGKKGEETGFLAAIGEGTLGILHEQPFLREMSEVSKAFTSRQRGSFFGEFAKSLAVPQLLQWLAGEMDKDESGEPVKRNPEGVLEHIETGVPGLRENAPVRSGGTVRKKRLPLPPVMSAGP